MLTFSHSRWRPWNSRSFLSNLTFLNIFAHFCSIMFRQASVLVLVILVISRWICWTWFFFYHVVHRCVLFARCIQAICVAPIFNVWILLMSISQAETESSWVSDGGANHRKGTILKLGGLSTTQTKFFKVRSFAPNRQWKKLEPRRKTSQELATGSAVGHVRKPFCIFDWLNWIGWMVHFALGSCCCMLQGIQEQTCFFSVEDPFSLQNAGCPKVSPINAKQLWLGTRRGSTSSRNWTELEWLSDLGSSGSCPSNLSQAHPSPQATGEPLCRAIVWLDLRTAETAAELSRGGRDRFSLSGVSNLSIFFLFFIDLYTRYSFCQ